MRATRTGLAASPIIATVGTVTAVSNVQRKGGVDIRSVGFRMIVNRTARRTATRRTMPGEPGEDSAPCRSSGTAQAAEGKVSVKRAISGEEPSLIVDRAADGRTAASATSTISTTYGSIATVTSRAAVPGKHAVGEKCTMAEPRIAQVINRSAASRRSSRTATPITGPADYCIGPGMGAGETVAAIHDVVRENTTCGEERTVRTDEKRRTIRALAVHKVEIADKQPDTRLQLKQAPLTGEVGPSLAADGDAMPGGVEKDCVGQTVHPGRREAQGNGIRQQNRPLTIKPHDTIAAIRAGLENLGFQLRLRAEIDRRYGAGRLWSRRNSTR